MFVSCWRDEVLDDFSGWIPVVLLLQLPAIPIAAHAATELPGALPRGWRLACACSLGLVTGFSVFFFCAIAGERLWHGDFFDFRAVYNGFLMGVIAMIATVVRFARRLRDQPHPRALRRGLLELIAVGLAVVALVLHGEGRAFFGTGMRMTGKLLLVALPFLWMAPLWLLMPRRAGPPRAVAL